VYANNNLLTYILPSVKIVVIGHRSGLAVCNLSKKHRSEKENMDADELSLMAALAPDTDEDHKTTP